MKRVTYCFSNIRIQSTNSTNNLKTRSVRERERQNFPVTRVHECTEEALEKRNQENAEAPFVVSRIYIRVVTPRQCHGNNTYASFASL